MMLRGIARKSFGGMVAVSLTTGVYTFGQTRSAPVDPGVRGGPAGAGTPLKGLTADETMEVGNSEICPEHNRGRRDISKPPKPWV